MRRWEIDVAHRPQLVYALLGGFGRVTDESETELFRCETCDQMVRPLTESAVSLVGATVVIVHACPHCGPQKVSLASPFSRGSMRP